MRTLVLIAAAAEALLIVVGVGYAVYRFRRRPRPAAPGREGPGAHDPPRPATVLDRLADLLGAGLPTPLARILTLELRLWRCFGAWLFRRRPRGSDAFTYHRRSPLGPMTVVVLLTTPVEVLLLELLIPILWIRVLLLVAAVYALFWVVALYASLVVLPHRLHSGGIHLHYGALADLWVPFAAVDGVALQRREGPKGRLGLSREGLSVAGEDAFFVMGGRTDLVVDFRRPLPVRMLRGDRLVHRAYVAADRPAELSAALQAAVEETPVGRLPGPGGPRTAQRPGQDSNGMEAEASSVR